MEKYRTTHVQNLYDVSGQTVRAWAEEFAQYLSPTANPGASKNRLFTQDDLAVIDLIADLKKQGMTFPEVHASLKSGQRGVAPNIAPDEVQLIVSSEVQSYLELEVNRMKSTLIEAQKSLANAQDQLAKLRHVEDENVRLGAKLESEEERRQIAEATVKELMDKVEDLSREIGREYTKGFMEGLKSQSSSSNGSE